MLKLIKHSDGAIPMQDMKDGDVGIIVTEEVNHDFKGKMIQRFKNNLVVIGEQARNNYFNFFDNHAAPHDVHVRLLHDGDILQWKDEE